MQKEGKDNKRNVIEVLDTCGLSDHSKTGPFIIRTTFYHLNTGLVRYSDDYCIPTIPPHSTYVTVGCFVLFKSYECPPSVGSSFYTAQGKLNHRCLHLHKEKVVQLHFKIYELTINFNFFGKA